MSPVVRQDKTKDVDGTDPMWSCVCGTEVVLTLEVMTPTIRYGLQIYDERMH